MSTPKLDRFSDRWEKETPLACFDCGDPLTETATTLYWDEHPMGDGEPRCLDCKSQIALLDAREPERKRELHPLSNLLFGCAIGCMVKAAFDHQHSGHWILAAIGCANLGLLTRIRGH